MRRHLVRARHRARSWGREGGKGAALPSKGHPLVSQVDTQVPTACGKCSEGEVHRVPLQHRRAIPNSCVARVPRTTLHFGDFEEGLTELRNTIILTITLCCRERVQASISRGKRYKGWNPGKTMHQLPGIVPPWSLRTAHNPSTSDSGHQGQRIADQGSSVEPWNPGLLLGVSP